MIGMCFNFSALHPSVYWHQQKGVNVVVHVDDFICVGAVKSLSCVFIRLQEKYALKQNIRRPAPSEGEMRHAVRCVLARPVPAIIWYRGKAQVAVTTNDPERRHRPPLPGADLSSWATVRARKSVLTLASRAAGGELVNPLSRCWIARASAGVKMRSPSGNLRTDARIPRRLPFAPRPSCDSTSGETTDHLGAVGPYFDRRRSLSDTSKSERQGRSKTTTIYGVSRDRPCRGAGARRRY